MSLRLHTDIDTATIQELIWQHAAQAPDTVAVVDADGQLLTYRELMVRAGAVADELAAIGVSEDDIVGVCSPRSVDGLVQMLGVWRAGAAVLYLDPDWPVQRLQYMTATCGVRIVRTAGPVPHLPLLAVPEGRSDAERAQGLNLRPGLDLPPVHGPLCYVVFTSGSTGTPKGVLIEHPGVLNMATALAEAFGIGAGTRVLQFAAWSWDAAMCEIVVTLGAGGTLVLAPPSARAGGPALAQLLRTQRVEVATLTPSVLTAAPADDLPDLRAVVAVGEVCHPHLVQRWTSERRRVLNGYGPTEATVAVTVGTCRPGEDVHIGTPLPGVTVQLVDPNGRPVPPGVVGEVLVGGVGVARGYAASPAATAARFTSDSTGRRWYHTGDLAAWRTDGALTYVGRTDDQVKVRGHRINLGEVEHILTTHPGVRGCAVITVADRIVAFVVADHDHVAALPAAQLAGTARRHAAALLPPFAVPDVVHVVAALPLTANGKTDRGILRSWATTQTPHPVPDNRAAPATGLLNQVVQVVSAVLDQPVQPNTDFIDAGGHSLLVAQLCVALSEALGVEVPYITVATNRTPATLTTAITHLSAPPGLGPGAGAR